MKKGSGEERGEATFLVWCARLASEKSVYFKCSIFLKVIKKFILRVTLNIHPPRKHTKSHIFVHIHVCMYVFASPQVLLCFFFFF